jgi:CheY-like chemotaxis protein
MLERMADQAETTAAVSPTVMIVDDDDEVRAVVAEFLQDFGYHVVQADSAATALALLEQTSDLRLMITDIRMPKMTGLELADIVAQRRGDVKIILISGYFVSQRIERRFLRKPFRMKELEDAVRAELGS